MDRVRELTPQFLKASKIDVMILKKINPVHFIIKEMPTLDMSREMKAFQELEKDLQCSYPDEKQRFSNIPKEKMLAIVHRVDDDKFYRASIREVQRGRPKTVFKVYLVDYGKRLTVTKDRLFMCKKEFENFPYQAVEFVLMGLQPFSLQLNIDATMGFGKAATWDCSADEHVDSLLERTISAQVATKGHYDENGRIYGSMYIVTEAESGTLTSPFCLDTYLIDKKYACMDINALRNEYFCCQPSVPPDHHDSVSPSVSSSSSSSAIGKQGVSSNASRKSLSNFGRGVNILGNLNTSPSTTVASSEKSSPSSIQTVVTATERKSLGSGSSHLVCFGRGVIDMKNLNFTSSFVNKSSTSSQKQQKSDFPPDSFSLSSPPLRRQSIVDDLVRESLENPQPSPSTVEVSMANSDSLSPSSSGRKNLSGNSPKRHSPCYGRGVNAIRELNQTSVTIKVPPLTPEQPKAMVESTSPCAPHEPKKSFCDKSSKKCSPSFGRGVNVLMNLNHTPISVNPSPAVNSENCITTANSLSPVKSEKKTLSTPAANKILPSFGRGVNGITHLKKETIKALVEDYAKNSANLLKASVTDNIGSDSSSVSYQNSSYERCTKSCSTSQAPFSLDGNANVHLCEGSENPVMSLTKLLDASDPCSKTSSLTLTHSSKDTLLSDASNGQFSDYESDDDSKDKLVIESASPLNSIQDKCPKIKTLSKLETSPVVNTINTSVSDCLSSQCGFNSQEISKSVHPELKEQILIEQEISELTSSNEKNIVESTESALSTGKQALIDQKNSLSTEEPADGQVLVGSEPLPMNSEIVGEQVIIESAKHSSCSKPMLIELEKAPATIEFPIKEIICKNSPSLKSDHEPVTELEIHSPTKSMTPCHRESFESGTSSNSLKIEITRLSLGRGRGSPVNNVPSTVSQYKEVLASKQQKSVSPLKVSKDENESIKVKSHLPSCPVSYTEIIPELMAQQNSSAEITENTKSPDCPFPSGKVSSKHRDSKEGSMASGSSIGELEDQQACSTPNDSFVEGLIQSIPNVAESSSCEDDDLEKDEAGVHGAITEPDSILQHLNNAAKNSSYWLTRENYQDTSQTDLDFTDQSLYNTRGSSVIKIGSGNDRQWFHVREASFDPYIQQRLKDINFCGPSCIQTAFWPLVTMATTQAIIAIGPQRSGKTVGYLVPILSNLIRGYEYEHLPQSNGPNMIILCSSWKKVVDVSRQAELFLGQCNKVNVLTLCTDGVDEQAKIVRLMNGCKILVATPLCLMQYSEKKAVTFNRCCHLIFDDGNDIVKHYPKILPTIMKTYLKCIESRKKAQSFIQLILCAEHWTRRLAAFVTKFMFHELNLLFVSSLEAAVYCQVPLEVHMCEESTKTTQLLSILGSMSGKRIIICSTNSESADIVHNTLCRASCGFLYARENMFSYDLKSLKMKWEAPHSEHENVIMVLTDCNLLQLDLDDADCLIHFDLPEVSRLQFSNRFSCIKKNMHSEKKEDLMCHVLFTEICQTQASSLLTILCRIGSNVPPELKHQSVIQKKAIKNMDMPLCHYMKSLGSCPVSNCDFRHIIDKNLDCPVVVPSEGDIHASVGHIFSPTHFYMKISRFIDPKTKTTVSVTGEYAVMAIELQDFYRANESELKSSLEIKVSELYGVKENMEYYRCKVLKIIEFQCQAKVLYIDEGFVKTVKFEQFRLLPEELRQKRPFAVEAYLCKVKPVDPYRDWNPGTTKYMFDLISRQEIDAKIVFCLGETLFLDPAVIRTGHISYVQGHVYLKHLCLALKSKGFAVANDKHLDLLYKSSYGKIKLPELLKSSPVEQTPADRTGANWAFLDIDSIELVFVSHIESPDQFFVQRAKSADSLDKLLKEIALKIEHKSLCPCQTLQVGMFCLAPCPSDESYNRSEVVNLLEVSGDMVAHVRFVDYGDCGQAKKSELFALPPELLLLPFQAIECSLAGVSPRHGGWTESVNDSFFDLTRDMDDNQIELKIKALEKTKRSAGGNLYTVDLQINSETYVSDYLVENGLAEEKEIPWRLDYIPDTNANHSEDDNVLSDDDGEKHVDHECVLMLAGVYSGLITPQNFDPCLARLRETSKQKSSVDTDNGKKVQNGSGAPLNTNQCMSVQSSPFPSVSNNDLTCSRIPLVTWWDTLQEVIVTIHVPDVQKYDLEIHADGFKFETTVMEKRYVVEETFYGEILKDEVEPKCLGSLIEFRFKKKTETIWLRLIRSNQKMFYIKRDLNHIDIDDEDPGENASHGASETASAGPSGINTEANAENRDRGQIESEEDSENNDSSSDDEQGYEGFAELCDPRSSFEFLS